AVPGTRPNGAVARAVPNADNGRHGRSRIMRGHVRLSSSFRLDRAQGARRARPQPAPRARRCAAMSGAALDIAPGIAIPESELAERFVTASGPGGQNVNKVASAVELRFDIRTSPSLPDALRERLLMRRDRRL